MRDVFGLLTRMAAYALVGVFWGITAISMSSVYKSIGVDA